MLQEKTNLDLQNELALWRRLARMRARQVDDLQCGRKTPEWIIRRISETERAIVPYTQMDILRTNTVLHPDGQCTCCGEGRCEWCLKHPDPDEADEREINRDVGDR